MQQVQPLLDWLVRWAAISRGPGPAVLVQVLGIALVAQLAADTCREAGLAAAATAIDLRRAHPGAVAGAAAAAKLLGSFAAYLQIAAALPLPAGAEELSAGPKCARLLDEGGTTYPTGRPLALFRIVAVAVALPPRLRRARTGTLRRSPRVSAAGGVLGLLAGANLEVLRGDLAVLGFGAMSLRAMHLTVRAADTAQDCQNYYRLCAGVQRPGRRRRADGRGAVSTAVCFLPWRVSGSGHRQNCFCRC